MPPRNINALIFEIRAYRKKHPPILRMRDNTPHLFPQSSHLYLNDHLGLTLARCAQEKCFAGPYERKE